MNQEYNNFVHHYHDNKNQLFTHLMYWLNFDRVIAENVMLDIFLRAYDHMEHFNPDKGSFKVWLFAIAHNYLDQHQNKVREAISPAKLKRENFIAKVDDAEYQMSEQMDNKQIQHIFTLLKEEDRELISLRYLQGLSPKEISQITGKREAIIEKNVTKALENISKLYKKIYLRK